MVITQAVLDWVERASPGARVAGHSVCPLPGGAVARRVEQVTLLLAGQRDPLELVRKEAAAWEIAGLLAAQAARPDTDPTAIPELVAWGDDWLITPLAAGSPLAWGDAVPANLFDTLAALHARYRGGTGLPASIPRVTGAWWQALCRDWVDPQLGQHAARHPPETTARARALIGRAADLPAASAVLADLPLTLLHGDVHPGNVVAAADHAVLVDWGSCRIGPAALDLANLVTADSAEAARYARAWQAHTGQSPPVSETGLGYRWAALQIPVQYLPWTIGHRPTRDVEASLTRIEQALAQLSN